MNRRRPVSHRRVSTHRPRCGTSNPPARRIAPLREGFQTKDISGSLQGAGGVGGLLAVRTGEGAYYPAYDNNGNIVAYADDSGALVASYAYDAFGNTMESSGPLADFFAHRFSTKSLDPETGLYYYGYRFYVPALGRWMNRDPIEEHGGVNLFSFVNNQPCSQFDYFGLRLIILPDSRIPILDEKRRVIGITGSGYLDKPTFHDYIETILVKVRYIVGDCIDLKWQEISDGFIQSATDFGKSRPNPVLITYVDKSETRPECVCTPCFSVLKKLLEDSEKTITIMHTSITDNAWARGSTVLMNQEPKIKNRFLTPRGEKEMFTDLRFVFWHEVIAHAYLEKVHEESPMNVLGIPDNTFYDETIEEENKARECFRQFTGRDLLAPERTHQYYPEGWTF